jgi:hypothetical protein
MEETVETHWKDEPNRLDFKLMVDSLKHSDKFLNMTHLCEVLFLDNSVRLSIDLSILVMLWWCITRTWIVLIPVCK